LGCDLVFLLLDCGFVGEAVDDRVDLFLGSVGVLKEVSECGEEYFSLSLRLISASFSICCLVLWMKAVVLERGFA
jgi:hypothetical protein